MSSMPKGLLECGNIDSQGAGLHDCRAQAGKEELVAGCLTWPPQAKHLLLCPWAYAGYGCGRGCGCGGGWGLCHELLVLFSCTQQRRPGAQCQRELRSSKRAHPDLTLLWLGTRCQVEWEQVLPLWL